MADAKLFVAARPNPAVRSNVIWRRRAARAFLDVSVSAFGFFFAYAILFRLSPLKEESYPVVYASLLFALTSAVAYLATGLFARSWRFVSSHDAFCLARDVFIAVAGFMALSALTTSTTVLTQTVPVIAWFVIVVALGGMRLVYRFIREADAMERLTRASGSSDARGAHAGNANATHLLVYGATAETDAFLRILESSASHRRYRVLGIIDDEPTRCDHRIRGYKVLGNCAALADIVHSFEKRSIAVKQLVLHTNDISRSKLGEIVDAATRARLRVVSVKNPCSQLLKPGDDLSFEPIKLTNLLGRDPVALRLDSIKALIRGKTVVVTGGGGSIGSELCRHLLSHQPASLIVIDHSEFNLFQIERELAAIDTRGVVQTILASVRDRQRMVSIFARAKVDFVFHAAAYKHVPLVEANPIEGILANVVGTANVAEAAAAAGAAGMIMVSTDKAVKPSSIMGLSKRVAEYYCQAMDLECGAIGLATRFMVVRFGNVLGSSGSVVPIFEQQIRKGGPITVTDPDMTRYFMTISEAVDLVLQGSAIEVGQKAARGAIMVLDMGSPVRIVDLAQRMIALAGFVPNRDIKIEFLGIRDGEKLHEELFDENEVLEEVDIPGVRLARSKVRDIRYMRWQVERLMSLAGSEDRACVIALLRGILADASMAPESPVPAEKSGASLPLNFAAQRARPKHWKPKRERDHGPRKRVFRSGRSASPGGGETSEWLN